MGIAPLLLLQAASADAATVDAAQTIAWAQMVMAITFVALLVLAIGGAIVSYNTLKALGRLIKEMEEVTKRLAPRADPIIDGAAKVLANLGDVSTKLRGDVEGMQDTMRDINFRLRMAADSAEDRVREFGDVLRVAQDEAQEMILGAAATARGVHTAADALREATGGPRRPPVRDFRDVLDLEDDYDDDDDDDFLED